MCDIRPHSSRQESVLKSVIRLYGDVCHDHDHDHDHVHEISKDNLYS